MAGFVGRGKAFAGQWSFGERGIQAVGYLWCSWLHRRHHDWTANWRRDCRKCKSWYLWPERVKSADKLTVCSVDGEVKGTFIPEPKKKEPSSVKAPDSEWPEIIE